MNFSELAGIFGHNLHLLEQAYVGTDYLDWLHNVDQLVRDGEWEKLHSEVPDEVFSEALKLLPEIMHLYSDGYLRSYQINELEWEKAGNSPVDVVEISYFEIFMKYGGSIIIEAIDKGGVDVSKLR